MAHRRSRAGAAAIVVGREPAATAAAFSGLAGRGIWRRNSRTENEQRDGQELTPPGGAGPFE